MTAVLSSMTGFARVSGEANWGNWAWEAKSVNGRGLDVRVGYPSGFEVLERAAKAAAASHFTRGSLQVSLKIEAADDAASLSVNRAALAALVSAHKAANEGSAPSDDALATLMTIKGVVEAGSQTARDLAGRGDVEAELMDGLSAVMNELAASRHEEGKSLKSILEGLIGELSQEVEKAAALAGTQPQLLKARLEKQLGELGAEDTVDADRLAAEIALSAAKADIREELDRLAAHIDTARTYLATGSPIGRKLDFLSQELNREANTLCSKSIHLDLTNVGLALKGFVDQFKEQAANVE